MKNEVVFNLDEIRRTCPSCGAGKYEIPADAPSGHRVWSSTGTLTIRPYPKTKSN